MNQVGLGVCITVMLAAAGRAQDVMRPANERYSGSATDQVPDFQKHVVPLLGQLGCNGRACHGSFQGQGGFRLSLFGYDFNMDHQALTQASGAGGQPRVNLRAAENSLILQKPLQQLDHEGGKRFDEGSWQHHLLRRWIEAGANGRSHQWQLDHLQVEPPEILFQRPGQSMSLRVIAVWKDGTREDVTCLCRFRTNDEAIAGVDADGQITAVGQGDTHVVAFYDNGVAAVPLMLPITERVGPKYPAVATATRIDELVVAKLRKLGIVPSELCGDAEFLRRVSIDMTGTLPTPAEIREFLADSSADKRSRKIDQLLQRPAYAAWWANKLCDFTGCNPQQQSELGQQLSVQWYMWTYQRLLENTPYDQLVARIVTATGRQPGQSYEQYVQQMSSYFRDNDPADFAQRETMPYYWSRRTVEQAADKSLAFAHSFLGIRLQCAQCHKHPYDRWTQEDFQHFTAFFTELKYGVAPESRASCRRIAEAVGAELKGDQGVRIGKDLLSLAEEGKTLPWRELYLADRSARRLRLLGGEQVELAQGADPRDALMRWMQRHDNPYFARVLVNRVWANYFHVGIIDPPDDLNRANPPSNRRLLDELSRGFVENQYDMKWLHREITNSATYQRSWRPNATNRQDHRNFSRAVPRRLPAEVVYDAIKQATAASSQLEEVRTDLTRRAVGHLSMRMAGTYAMQVFGKPERAVNCDCERVNEPTLLQAVFLQNDPLLQMRLQSSGWLDEIAQIPSHGPTANRHAALVEEAYLRTVGRLPSPQEHRLARRHVDRAESTLAGMRDLMWVLLNTKEFILNH